jgi:hypothetical protein
VVSNSFGEINIFCCFSFARLDFSQKQSLKQ